MVKRYLWFIEVYVFQFPLDMLHELAHWLFVFFTWLYSMNSFPTIHITRWPTRIVNDDNTAQIMSLKAHVHYKYYGQRWSLHLVICSIMPLFMALFLFGIMPWWFWIYLIANITVITPSEDDVYKITMYFKLRKRARKIKTYGNLN